MRFDVVLNNLVAWAFATGRVLIQSDGTPWRSLVHVEDICRAFLAVLVAPTEAVHNQAFNVGITEENYQLRDLAAIVQSSGKPCLVATLNIPRTVVPTHDPIVLISAN
jgi:nucleoside-diphosphate-sugar epimerase